MLIEIFEKHITSLPVSLLHVSFLLFAKVNFEEIKVIYKQETP